MVNGISGVVVVMAEETESRLTALDARDLQFMLGT